MPIITIEGPPITDIEKRRTLTTEVTRSAAASFGMPEEKIIILFRENSPEQVAVGGVLLCDRK